LSRTIGPWSAGAIVAGSMIGTGIFFFVAPVAAKLGSAPAILAAWAAGAVLASCGALCLSELAAAYPRTGGVYEYLSLAFGPGTGFVYTWVKFFVMRVASLAIATLAFAIFCCEFLGLSPTLSADLRQPLAIAAVLLITVINHSGVRHGAFTQNVLTAIKIAGLLAIIAVGVGYAAGALEPRPVEFSATAVPVPTGLTLLSFCIALVPVMWTLGGWDESPFVAGEVRDAPRALPISIMGGLWTVALLFILVNAAYLAILSPSEFAASGEHTATLAMERALGPSSRRALALLLMISTLGLANGLGLTGARLLYATGSRERLFRWATTLSPGSGVPARALWAQATLTVLAIVIMSDPYRLLLFTGVPYWVFAGMTGLAVVVLRIRDPLTTRPFTCPAYPGTPALFTAASVAMIVAVAVEAPRDAMAGVAIMATGVVVYLVQQRLDSRRS